jgi:hypothetical protein
MQCLLRSVDAAHLGLPVLDLTARRSTVLGADEENLLLAVPRRLAGQQPVAIGSGVSVRREVSRVVELREGQVAFREPARFSTS